MSKDMRMVFARTTIVPVAAAALVLSVCVARLGSHGFGSTPTWNREISRIVFDKCASCHRPGGTAFSMMTFLDVQRRGNEIKDAVVSRRMPPWGAVKGVGSFLNDQSLTQEQIELVRRWVDGGIRRGNNPAALPKEPSFVESPRSALPPEALDVSGDVTLSRALTAVGVVPRRVPPGRSIRVTAILPDGRVEPLVWLHGYDSRYAHPFLFRRSLALPARTVIHGVPADASLTLLALQ